MGNSSFCAGLKKVFDKVVINSNCCNKKTVIIKKDGGHNHHHHHKNHTPTNSPDKALTDISIDEFKRDLPELTVASPRGRHYVEALD
jgi:hypothetical protein